MVPLYHQHSQQIILSLKTIQKLEAVFADILGRPDSESDKTMIADINSSHLEGEYYKDAFGSGYYGNTYLNVMFRSSDYVDYGDAITIN